MKQTKVIKTLLNFNRYELNRLEKFVSSPYHNMNKAILGLFGECKNAIISDHYDTEEEVWSRIHTNEFNSRKFQVLCSQLLVLVQEFLAYEEFEKNPVHKAAYLLQGVKTKKMELLYNTGIKSAKRLSERQLYKSNDYYYFKYKLERLFYDMSGLEIKRRKKLFDEKFNVEEIARNLDIFYFSEKIKYQTTLINWSNLVEHESEITFIEEILDHVVRNQYPEAALQMYYQMYLTYIDPDNDSHYVRLYELIKEQIEIFPPDEARDVLDSAINYCIRRLNKGNQGYLEEVLKLYQEGLESEILLQNSELPPATFRNICTASFRLEKFEWAEYFINHYQQFLNEEFRQNAVSLTKAQLYFYKNEYEKVLGQLRNVEYQDLNYNLVSKVLHCATYYEMDEIDVLTAFMESYRIFLTRNKRIPKKRKMMHTNFIKELKFLIGNVYNKKLLEVHRSNISDEKMIVNKAWLLQKYDEALA